jgi:hypothetical protein
LIGHVYIPFDGICVFLTQKIILDPTPARVFDYYFPESGQFCLGRQGFTHLIGRKNEFFEKSKPELHCLADRMRLNRRAVRSVDQVRKRVIQFIQDEAPLNMSG